MTLARVRGHCAAVAVALLALAGTAMAQALPPEVQVGTREIKDFEFDSARDGVYCAACNGGAGNSRLAYIDSNHQLWVGRVNPGNGNFNPPDGKDVLVDTNATTATEIGNGPEWVDSGLGSQLVYTRWTDGKPRQAQYLQLGLAYMSGGSWMAGPIERSKGRVLPVGTDDPDGPYPFLHFQNFSTPSQPTRLYWRGMYPDSTEMAIPMLSQKANITRRWVPHTLDIILTAQENAVVPMAAGGSTRQVFLYHAATGTLEQLTFDDVNKFWAFMWPAPEFDNEQVFVVMVGGDRLRIYRKLDNGNGPAWTVVKTINMPDDMPYVTSPEPFVYRDRSWISFTLSADPTGKDFSLPSLIAISGIVPGVDSLRILTSGDGPARVRRDPEYFITANGPYIYYNRYIPQPGSSRPISEGVFRVDTQLGAAAPARVGTRPGR